MLLAAQRERIVTRLAERRVTRRHGRYLTLLASGRRTRRTDRSLHNDFDVDCIHWFGDRNPERNDRVNRDFGGAATALHERRCLVCRPYTEDESLDVLGYNTPVIPATG